MGSKGSTGELSPARASLLNVKTGDTYEIPVDGNFTVGRSLSCSIVIEKRYMSRRHCVISYDKNQFKFMIYDNKTNAGTYINFKKLSRDQSHLTILNNGDLIGFSDKKNLEVIYQFNLTSITEKKPRLEQQKEIFSEKIMKLNTNYKNSLEKLHTEVINLKGEKLELRNKTQDFISTFKVFINSICEYINKLGTHIINEKNIRQDLTKQISEYKNTLFIQQEQLNNENLLALNLFKNEINNYMEEDLKCAICNNIIIETSITNCSHIFCKRCINRWLNKNKICPICRIDVKATTNCLVLDDFITNLCNKIGGTVKEQRDNLLKRKINISGPTARRGRKRINNGI